MKDTQASKPLNLQASLGAWRLYSARKLDVKFESFQRKVLERDNFRCHFCGFQAKKYQDVVNLDGNFLNNSLQNMVTACCFCAQCFFVESVGVGGYGGGSLIYLPEFSQNYLNALCHVLFCAITNNTGYKSTAQLLYRTLKQRSIQVEQKFGEGSSDPAILGQLIIDSGISSDQINTIFSNIRLLPSRGRFRMQIEYWAASAL